LVLTVHAAAGSETAETAETTEDTEAAEAAEAGVPKARTTAMSERSTRPVCQHDRGHGRGHVL
jgi:hypothetical protein